MDDDASLGAPRSARVRSSGGTARLIGVLLLGLGGALVLLGLVTLPGSGGNQRIGAAVALLLGLPTAAVGLAGFAAGRARLRGADRRPVRRWALLALAAAVGFGVVFGTSGFWLPAVLAGAIGVLTLWQLRREDD